MHVVSKVDDRWFCLFCVVFLCQWHVTVLIWTSIQGFKRRGLAVHCSLNVCDATDPPISDTYEGVNKALILKISELVSHWLRSSTNQTLSWWHKVKEFDCMWRSLGILNLLCNIFVASIVRTSARAQINCVWSGTFWPLISKSIW